MSLLPSRARTWIGVTGSETEHNRTEKVLLRDIRAREAIRRAEPLLTIVQVSDRVSKSQTCQIQRRTRRGTPVVYQIRMSCRRELSIMLKCRICEGCVVMDVRAHTVVWYRILHAERGDVHIQRGTFLRMRFAALRTCSRIL